ncbi:MAG: hypothetical protein C4318_04235 [Acidimicrobiia bacterium]
MKREHSNLDFESGQSFPLVMAVLMIVLAIGGLVLDGSRAFLIRRQLQNALDAAVLAGAGHVDLEKFKGSIENNLEPERLAAVSAAERVFTVNAPTGSRAWFQVQGARVEGAAVCTVSFVLLPLVGLSGYEVHVRASASPVLISGG